MNVSTMIAYLQNFDGDSPVVFTPRNMCSGGWPEWNDCRIRAEVAYDEDDNSIPTGTVIVEISDEVES